LLLNSTNVVFSSLFDFVPIPMNVRDVALLLKAAFHAQLGGNAILSDIRWYVVDLLTVGSLRITVLC